MTNPVAILIGAALIAVAILYVFRWEIAAGPPTVPVVRLDHWTGKVTVCNASQDAAREASQNHTALDMDCVTPSGDAAHKTPLPQQ